MVSVPAYDNNNNVVEADVYVDGGYVGATGVAYRVSAYNNHAIQVSVPSGYTWQNFSYSGTVNSSNPLTLYISSNITLTAHYAATASSIFSDGFESGNFSASTSTTGSPSIENTDPRSGTYHAYFARSTTGACYIRKTGFNLSEIYAKGLLQVLRQPPIKLR